MIVIQQIIKAWDLHNDAMLLTILNIPVEAYALPVPNEGGGTIKDQIILMLKARLENLHTIKKTWTDPYLKNLGNVDIDALKKAFLQSGNLLKEAATETLEKREHKLEVVMTEMVHAISSLIRTEFRQRRNIMSELKRSGYKLNNRFKLEI